MKPLKIGIGGPVGSGKTALIEKLCKTMRDTFELAAITNGHFHARRRGDSYSP